MTGEESYESILNSEADIDTEDLALHLIQGFFFKFINLVKAATVLLKALHLLVNVIAKSIPESTKIVHQRRSIITNLQRNTAEKTKSQENQKSAFVNNERHRRNSSSSPDKYSNSSDSDSYRSNSSKSESLTEIMIESKKGSDEQFNGKDDKTE